MLPTFFDSPGEYAAACGVVALAQAVYALLGFGAGLIAVGGLALVFPDVRDVVVLLLLVNLPVETFYAARSRRQIEWKGVLRILAGVVVGIPLGAVALRYGEADLLLVALGVSLVLIGCLFAWLPATRRVVWPGWTGPPVGLLSGLLTGLFGTGGPPLIVYYRLGGLDKSAFRGHLMTIFLAKTLVRVPSYLAAGLITAPRLGAGLAVLPAVLLGAWTGHRLHLDLPERRFRRLVGVALLLIGLLLLARTLES